MSGVENNRTTDAAKKAAAPSSTTIASASEKRSPWGVLNLVGEEHRTPSPQQLPTTATMAAADKSSCGKGKGSENKAPKQIILNWNPFLIGRNETTSVIIPNPCISGVHCIFSCVRQSSQHPHPSSSARQAPTQVADGEEEEASNQPPAVLDASIADTSTNGCYVNGARLGKGSTRRLVEGDEIDLVISKKAEHSCFDIKYRFSYQVPLPQHQPVKVTTSTHQQLATAAKKSTVAATAVSVKPLAAEKEEQKQSRVVTPPPPPLYPGLKEEAHQHQRSAKEVTTTSSSTAPRIPTPVNADQQALPSGNLQQQVPAAGGGGLLGRVGSSVVSGVKGFFKLVTGSNQQMDGGQGGGAGGGVPSMMGPTALDATTEAAGGGGMVSGGNSLATKNQQTSASEGVTISAGTTMKKVKSNIPFEKRYAMSEETVLGKGSFATVYKAIKTDNGQVVAIKEVNMARTLQHMKDRADGEAKPVALTNEDEMKRRRDELRQKREIEILQAVSHPHVVQLLDFEHVSAKRLAFVLEFAHGGELFGLIKKLGHLEEDEAAVIAKQLLYGVCYLHSIGVVHRDLKLENILLRNQVLLDDGESENGSAAATGRAGAATPPAQTSRPVAAQPKHLGMTPMLGSFRTSPPGKSGAAATGSARAAAAGNPSSAGGGNNLIDKSKLHIKIADFGLSRILSSEDTLMSTMCGTPIYVAPEVTMHALRPNRSGYTSAADMWSVGVIVYALLCGRPPFPHAKDEKGYRHKTRIEYNSPIDWTVAPLNPEQTTNRKGVGRGVGPSSSAHPRTPASLVPTRPGVVRPGQPYHHQHQQHAGPQVISMHARSFLSSLLVMKPEGRSTAHEALNHPWLRDVALPEGTGHPPSSSSDLEQQEDDDNLKNNRGGEEKRSHRTANKQQRFGNTVMEDSQLFDPMRLPPPTNAVGDDAAKKASAAAAPVASGSIRGEKKAGGSTGLFGRRKRLRDPKQPEDAASTSSGDLGCSDNEEEDNDAV